MVRELDREEKSNYTLIVKASEDCINTPENLSLSQPKAISIKSSENEIYQITSQLNLKTQTMKNEQQLIESHVSKENLAVAQKYSSEIFHQHDSTLVRVLIYVKDINDNPPVFTQKIFTGGVTTSTSFGTQFMKLTVSINVIFSF